MKWAEQGRLHTKYTQCGTAAVVAGDNVTFDINDALVPDRAATGLTAGTIAIRVGQTVVVSKNDGTGEFKGIVTAVGVAGGLNANQIVVAFYNAQGFTGGTGAGNADATIFIYGSEFKKGTTECKVL